ncbi:class I ribonucleotide reductase maintenance protein YfaE [Psychromonas aquimarina]|uniref:class I ribonucleotide reductase maintenance protein YfaE n=1 Tax=Psychromonas aquimarina TaxID=444919 RepID=UPI000407EE6A|nr:class I ribonucleotide reductase maintenance protein YfaE [Psychromonas aquimarina]
MSAKLTVDGIEYPLNTEKTLLENLESQAVKVEFHCRDGHCGACRCLLISGQPEYISYPMAYLRDGDVLTCCCTAKDDIKLATYR